MQSTRMASNSVNVNKKDSVRKGSLPQKNKKQIPRVQIFLDQHLSKAIGQIRRQKIVPKQVENKNNHNLILRHKRRSTYEQQDTMQQSYKGKNSMMRIIDDHINDEASSIINSPSLNPNNISKQGINKNYIQTSKSQIELMPNDIVLQYIHEVYQKYGIENPFKGYLDGENIQKTKRDDLTILIKEQSQEKKVKNWHSFSQRKDRITIDEGINGNKFIRQQINEYQNDDNSHQVTIINNENNTVRTQKKPSKKISQNQQKILQLKNKFKQIDELISNNYRNQSASPHPIKPITMAKINHQHKPSSSFHLKQSSGNITYIDNLKNLMQSQFTQFDTSAKNISSNSGRDKVSLKFIDSMGQILYDDNQLKINDNYLSSPHQLQSAIRPKKKLFVKTRGTSTKYNSVQATPVGDSGRKVRFDHFLQSQNKQQQSVNERNKLFQINQQIYQQSTVNNTLYSQPMTLKQSLTSSLTNSGIYIPQYHRYCFGCEQPILDSNILFHQQNCQQLKKISHLSLNELISLADTKLTNLKSRLGQSQLFNLKIDDINEIKSLGKIMLNEQLTSSQKDKNDQKKLKGQKQNLNKIDRLLQKKVLKGCQMIKKIQWFMKLKAAMQTQLQSQQSKRQENQISTFTLK